MPLDKACVDGDSEELDEEQTSRFRSSVLESRKGTRTQKRKVVEAIVETSTRVRNDVSKSRQEEVKQTSVVTQTAEVQETASTTGDSPRGEVKSMCARATTRRKWRSSMETLSGRRRCSGM